MHEIQHSVYRLKVEDDYSTCLKSWSRLSASCNAEEIHNLALYWISLEADRESGRFPITIREIQRQDGR